MFYDIIIIGGGASGLFCAVNAPRNHKKLIIEKQNKLGTKILLSGGGRCNFSNTTIDPDKYFGLNKKMLPSVFHKFDNHDMQNFLEHNHIQTKIEDNGRIILKSGKSKDLLDLLVKKAKENETKIKLNQDIIKVENKGENFSITIQDGENTSKYHCKKLIIATGGVSSPQTGTTGYGITLAKQFGLEIIQPYAALCGIKTQTNLNTLSGTSILSNLEIIDQHKNKLIYQQTGNILFTHIGLSGPAIFNASAAIGEYLTKQKIDNKQYLQENIIITLNISKEHRTKRLHQSKLLSKNNELTVNIENITNINTAKVSGGGISMSEIKPNFESKKIPNLYFIGETLDITGQTGGFNLQRAWTSGFVCAKNL